MDYNRNFAAAVNSRLDVGVRHLRSFWKAIYKALVQKGFT